MQFARAASNAKDFTERQERRVQRWISSWVRISFHSFDCDWEQIYTYSFRSRAFSGISSGNLTAANDGSFSLKVILHSDFSP